MAVEAWVTETGRGAIVFDPVRLGTIAEPAWFDAEWWRERGTVATPPGGRGSAWRVHAGNVSAVLRHYRRGGFAARFLHDRYWFRSAEHTRPFREFALLRSAMARRLPAPRPLAARYERHGWWYRADILVEAIEHALTLAQALVAKPSHIPWPAIGRCIARFHRAGFDHADLNAHNVLLRGEDVWLIDFDRGEQRAAGGTWQQRNLDRLHRSLLKLAADSSVSDFETQAWAQLLAVYSQEMAEPAEQPA